MRRIILNIISIFILMGLLGYFVDASAATCTSISRTNNSANSVLTSTKLNSDFNTAYTAINNFDGGCVTDGTLEISSTDSSWDNLKNYLQAGCKVSYSNASTVSISKCYMAVNGAFVSKGTATTASFGCTNCSSEAASTTYYLYAANGSSGTTLTPLILTGAPNADGYDASSNKVLARFYNNSTGDLDQYSIDQWAVNKFIPQEMGWTAYTPSSYTGFGTPTNVNFQWRRGSGNTIEIIGNMDAGTVTGDVASIALPNNYTVKSGFNQVALVGDLGRSGGSVARFLYVAANSGESVMKFTNQNTGAETTVGADALVATGEGITINASIPVEEIEVD